jgi:hypothetical protein
LVYVIGNSVDRNVNAEKLPRIELRLNASKPEFMLERGDLLLFQIIHEYE